MGRSFWLGQTSTTMLLYFVNLLLTLYVVNPPQPKYFDSGDYNMAQAKMKNKQLPAATAEKTEFTGDHIPTPQDLPQRKPSIEASKLAV